MKSENLEQLFEKIEKFFEKIINDESWFPDGSGIQNLAKEAWNKEIRNNFKKLKKQVMESDDAKLAQVGLAGNQLRFKMHIFNYFYGKDLIEKGLAAINSILGSLSFFGFSLAEPIKEFKDFLELVKQ